MPEDQIPKELRSHNKSPTRGASAAEAEEQQPVQVVDQPAQPDEQGIQAGPTEEPVHVVDQPAQPDEQGEQAGPTEDNEENSGNSTPRSDMAGDEAEEVVQQMQTQQREIEELRAQLKLLSTVKYSGTDTKVPTFSGVKDDRSAELWLAKLDSLATQFEWSDSKYIETAVNAMTKDAEAWAASRRFTNAMGTTNTWENKESFRKDFLAFFQDNRTQVERLTTWTTVKQRQDESVRSFWIRVDTANTEFIKQHLINEGWDITTAEAGVTKATPEDTTLVRTGDAEADKTENDKRVKELVRQETVKALIKFANDKLRDIFFFQGLKPAIKNQLSTKLDELGKLKVTILEAATNVESIIGSEKAMNAVTQEVAASSWPARRGGGAAAGRGGRGSRGSMRGGRGGGQQAGGAQQTTNTPPGYNKLKKIQGRQRSIWCERCCQHGRHYKDECRRPWAQIATMEYQDPHAPPSVCTDPFYDGLTEMPPKPKDDPQEQGN